MSPNIFQGDLQAEIIVPYPEDEELSAIEKQEDGSTCVARPFSQAKRPEPTHSRSSNPRALLSRVGLGSWPVRAKYPIERTKQLLTRWYRTSQLFQVLEVSDPSSTTQTSMTHPMGTDTNTMRMSAWGMLLMETRLRIMTMTTGLHRKPDISLKMAPWPEDMSKIRKIARSSSLGRV